MASKSRWRECTGRHHPGASSDVEVLHQVVHRFHDHVTLHRCCWKHAVEKRCGPRARPGPETSKSLWFGHDQEIVCGASAVCTCIFNLCWPAGRGMRCLPGWLCCGKGVVASAPRAPQAGPPFRLFARMSSFPAAHTAGDYRHCRVNFVVRGGEEHTEPQSLL